MKKNYSIHQIGINTQINFELRDNAPHTENGIWVSIISNDTNCKFTIYKLIDNYKWDSRRGNWIIYMSEFDVKYPINFNGILSEGKDINECFDNFIGQLDISIIESFLYPFNKIKSFIKQFN